jgi:ubiquinone/menaquinone biosynthesis C-methylase UbiE
MGQHDFLCGLLGSPEMFIRPERQHIHSGDNANSTNSTSSTPARYDAIAGFYEGFAPDTYDDPPLASLLELVGDMSGLGPVDIACGHGRLSRELARRGAQVTGVDISAALLDKALKLEQADPPGIAYLHADAASPYTLPGEELGGAVRHFGLSDIDDLEGRWRQRRAS